MPSSGLGAYQVKIHQIVFGGLFFAVVAFAIRAMMFGGTVNVKLLAVASILVAAVLVLDKYYWVLLPVLSVSGISFPGLPFSGRELGCIILIGMYFVRQAIHKEYPIRLTRKTLIAFPIFIWICAIWIFNPTGMTILGSSSIGARFYFQIVLGFLTLLVLSSFRFTERDCKILFFVLVVASLASFLLVQLNVRMGVLSDDLSLEAGQSQYHLLGALTLYTLMFSRYPLSEILRSLWKLLLVLFLAALTVYSGKRRAFGTLILLPFLRTFFTGRDKLAVVVCSMFGAVLIGLAVAGDGALWALPQSAKRALSVVVPEYATSGSMGIHDVFRENVRLQGREVIRNNPWMGRKGFAMDRGETSWLLFGGQTGLYEGHAYSGNWHSTWYAFACDFGLPAMVMWALFFALALFWTYQGFRGYGFGDYSLSVYIYYAFSFFITAIFSYTSGHSAHSAIGTWLVWGFLIAIQNGASDPDKQQHLRINA